MIEKLPFTLETELERRIASDPVWREGVEWGQPRTGHLEGAVKNHIADILANIEKQQVTPEERRDLRLIALLHDTLKYHVNEKLPKIGVNHHAYLARRFAERYIHDPTLLDIIELHDEAYNAWRIGHFRGKWDRAQERVELLLRRLGGAMSLYVHFFCADSLTESKDRAPVLWFMSYLADHGYHVAGCPS